MTDIEKLSDQIDDFEKYILNNEVHVYLICKNFENKIIELINIVESNQIDVVKFKNRLKKLILATNLNF